MSIQMHHDVVTMECQHIFFVLCLVKLPHPHATLWHLATHRTSKCLSSILSHSQPLAWRSGHSGHSCIPSLQKGVSVLDSACLHVACAFTQISLFQCIHGVFLALGHHWFQDPQLNDFFHCQRSDTCKSWWQAFTAHPHKCMDQNIHRHENYSTSYKHNLFHENVGICRIFSMTHNGNKRFRCSKPPSCFWTFCSGTISQLWFPCQHSPRRENITNESHPSACAVYRFVNKLDAYIATSSKESAGRFFFWNFGVLNIWIICTFQKWQDFVVMCIQTW